MQNSNVNELELPTLKALEIEANRLLRKCKSAIRYGKLLKVRNLFKDIDTIGNKPFKIKRGIRIYDNS